MKKILLSLAVLALALVAGYAGTRAFFSDTEVSSANAFTAGAVDIKINNIAHIYQNGSTANGNDVPTYTSNGFTFNLSDLKPLDWGEVTYKLGNDNNDAYVCAKVDEKGNAENNRIDPEVNAGDTTGPLVGVGNGKGELQNFMSFNINGSTGLLSAIDGQWFNVGTLLSGSNQSAAIGYCFGEYTGTTCGPNTTGDENTAQTDSMLADVSFYAVQKRNNPNFDCSSLNDDGGEQTQKVGATFADYSATVPQCTITVTDSNSIQTAINSAADNSVVCVDSNYNRTGDNSVIHVNDGITLVATTQGVALDVPVELDSDDTTVQGFAPTMGQIESPAEIAAIYVNGGVSNFKILSNTLSYSGGHGDNGGNVRGIVIETGSSTGGLIENNTITGFNSGIYLNPHTGLITIQYNDIDNNGAGVGAINGALVQNNEFGSTTAGSEAIGADSTYDGSTIQYNNFLDGTKINTYSVTTNVNAPNNFFNVSAASQTDAGVNATTPAAAAYPHN